MVDFLRNLFDTGDFPARWQCGNWSAGHGWLHIASDLAIFGAYTAIPCVLAFFVLRRKDVPFPRIMWLFVAFIFACGTGHLIEAIIFWEPMYRLSGVVKLTTALVSWGTVLALVVIVPQALHLPGLARLNAKLHGEIDERKRAEEALRQSEDQLAGLLSSEKHARAEAERANRVMDEFLSTVSHELRTPLNAILGYAQLLRQHKAEKSDVEDGLAVIERNAKVQSQIIEDLLDVSRIVSGKVRLDVQSVDLAQVIEAAVATVRPAADAKNIRIQTVLDRRAEMVLGDNSRLQQIVWNLLANAIKFTPKHGRVQVELERVNSHVEIRVCDSGQGIKPEFLRIIFDRFRQSDASTTKRHGGLGLGLAIVKHLVELHGGTIKAHSDGEGQGAMFVVSLPVQIVHPDQTPAVLAHSAGAPRLNADDLSLAGVRILIVDDEPDSRELARRLLARHGASVTGAASVDEALERFGEQTPDVVLSDIGMPDRDGYDLMSAIRARSEAEGGRVPAIALTALARADDRKRAMLAGFQAHIAKPVDPDELVAIVATFTGRTGRSVP
jgi:signal transduction histidine kinase/ActR/RegA family two-component response regulator